MTLDSAAQTNKQTRVLWWLVHFLELSLQWAAKIGRETSPINGLNDIFCHLDVHQASLGTATPPFFSCEQFARWPACVANKQLGGGAGRQKKICLETSGNHSPVYCNLRFFVIYVNSLSFELISLAVTVFFAPVCGKKNGLNVFCWKKQWSYKNTLEFCHKTWRIIWIWINHSINLHNSFFLNTLIR